MTPDRTPPVRVACRIQRTETVMSTSIVARNTRLAQAKSLSGGVGKHAHGITTLVIDGHPYTAADKAVQVTPPR
jgi:hypothetical protein